MWLQLQPAISNSNGQVTSLGLYSDVTPKSIMADRKWAPCGLFASFEKKIEMLLYMLFMPEFFQMALFYKYVNSEGW